MIQQFPIYIISKGRWESRITARALDDIGLNFFIVVEEQEFDKYAEVIDKTKILILDKKYFDEYETFDYFGSTKSKGPGAARNFCWDHSISIGATAHWVMDDNIDGFYRLNRNTKIRVSTGAIFRACEDFSLRYKNVAISGPNYLFFAKRKQLIPPFITNTRIYSCLFIRNDIPYRWRGRYNEDTDLCLRALKDGWCTIQFNAFLQNKAITQSVKGGNTAEFYSKEGTSPKSRLLKAMHPDVTELVWKFGREHHQINYKPFQRANKLIRKPGLPDYPKVDEYGMKLISLDTGEEIRL